MTPMTPTDTNSDTMPDTASKPEGEAVPVAWMRAKAMNKKFARVTIGKLFPTDEPLYSHDDYATLTAELDSLKAEVARLMRFATDYNTALKRLIMRAHDMSAGRSVYDLRGVTEGETQMGDWRVVVEELSSAESAERELAEVKTLLLDPQQVHVNMLRGTIAKLSVRQFVDTHGECVNTDDAQLLEIARLRSELAEARKLLERAFRVIGHDKVVAPDHDYANCEKCQVLAALSAIRGKGERILSNRKGVG